MLLTDADILDRIKQGSLGIDPFDESQVQPASYDFRIADEWSTFELKVHEFFGAHDRPYPDTLGYLPLDRAPEELIPRELKQSALILVPGEFVLARTQEVFRFPDDVGGKVWTRSSLARLGLRVANDGGWIDPGFHGSIVLEVRNDGPIPIKIPAGMRVGQVTFFKCARQAAHPYSGSYSGQFDFAVDRWKESLKKAALEAADRKS